MFLVKTQEVSEKENFDDFRTLQEWGLETQCKLRFPGSSFQADATASSGIQAGAVSCLTLTDVSTSTNRGVVSFRPPSLWTSGVVKVGVHYSASAAGGDYRVQASLYSGGSGDSILSSPTTSTETLSAISGAWRVGEHTFSAERSVDPSHTFWSLRLFREGADAADTDTGDLCILEATIIYEPSRY